MFKKLLSNLPYNPSLIGQVSFYAKRLHRESSVRKAGFIMMALAMMLQSLAVFSPPQSSLQASPNTDLLNGGFSSKAEAVKHCRDNDQDYKQIMSHFGISCDAIANSEVTHIAPRDHGGELWSMGRLSFGTKGETSVNVPGAGKFYVRHFWSLNHDSSYKALKVKNSDGKTVYILFECGNIVSIGIPAPPRKDVCDNVAGVQTSKEDCDVCPNKPGTQLKPAECDICPDKAGTQTKGSCDVCPDKAGTQTTVSQCDVCPNIPGVQTTKDKCDVCPNREGVQSNESECKPCEQSQTRDDLTACLLLNKKAKNITQNIGDANGTTAKASDTIEYTLTTTNKGKIDIKDFQVVDGFGDVLDYADVVDLHGGTIDNYGNVSWPKETIKAGKSSVHTVTIKVKSVIPSTPASSSDSQHFNGTMTNVYGDVVNIDIPGSVTKNIEIATTQIPNTGPGTSLAIGFGLAVFIAYFFARSRLLAKELDVVRTDFGSAGGY